MSEIGNVFKMIWKVIRGFQSAVGTILFLILMLWIGLAVLVDTTPSVPDEGALVINPVGFIVEQKKEKTTWEIIFEEETNQVPETRLRDIATAIRHAKTDERITSLVLNMDYFFGAGVAQLHYLGQLITDFKRTGKPVYAYSLGYSNSQYLLASYADEIYMHPFGSVILTGYGNYPLYYREALEKIKAQVHVFRSGEYKSLAEPYTRDDMSPETREANLALLTTLWGEYTAQVWASRGITPDVFQASYDTISDDLAAHGGDFGQLALDQGLVDGLMSDAEWQEFLTAKVAANGNGNHSISFANYLQATEDERQGASNQIAVVTVSGEIVLGESQQGIAGSHTIIRHLKTARLDSNVKAVVLRIDSPGGGLFASELIREEVVKLKEAGKPVIASMGSVAASGGYYIAAPADEIWAQATTITGSIGVIGMLPTFENTLDAIGVHVDGVGTTPLSDEFVFGKTLSPLALDILQQSVDNSYSGFIQMVAENRDLPPEEVDAVGQGRVWSGTAAKDFGLVDDLGNFEDAVASAALRADISDYQTRFIEDQPDFSQGLVEWFFATTDYDPVTKYEAPSIAREILHDLEKAYRAISAFNDPNSVYLLCEGCEVR